jgi:hypothetical protein
MCCVARDHGPEEKVHNAKKSGMYIFALASNFPNSGSIPLLHHAKLNLGVKAHL